MQMDSRDAFRLGTFAALVNGKLIVPSATSTYFAVERFLLVALLAPAVDAIALDERWYLWRNPDVRDAISRGHLKDAREHYRRHGYFEGRMPYRIEIDREWYESTYADVHEAVKRQDFASAQDHFEKLGYTEGRLPYAGFTLKMRDAAPPAALHAPSPTITSAVA